MTLLALALIDFGNQAYVDGRKGNSPWNEKWNALQAEIEGIAEAISYPEGCTPTDIRVLRQANVDLAAESERNRVDAERYRWLRQRRMEFGVQPGVDSDWATREQWWWKHDFTPEEADQCIDEMMAMHAAALAAKDSP